MSNVEWFIVGLFGLHFVITIYEIILIINTQKK